MKRILTTAILIASSSAAFAVGVAPIASVTADAAYQVCDGSKPGSGKTSVLGGAGAIPATGTNLVFTRSGFDIQCSANVNMSVQEVDANLALVAANSAKGNQTFAGHSNGGAITASDKCPNNKCTTSEIGTALGKAKTAASASGS